MFHFHTDTLYLMKFSTLAEKINEELSLLLNIKDVHQCLDRFKVCAFAIQSQSLPFLEQFIAKDGLKNLIILLEHDRSDIKVAVFDALHNSNAQKQKAAISYLGKNPEIFTAIET